jgi:hypothetical protein
VSDVTLEFPSELREEELFDPPADLMSVSAERPVWRLRYADGRAGWLDPSRDASGHILFGFGRSLMARFPTLRLAVPRDEVSLMRSGFLHGAVLALPVEW